MTHYGGFKHAIDSYKSLTEQMESKNTLNEERMRLVRRREKLGFMPSWMLQLEWPEHQKLPTPIEEITHDEWMLVGLLSSNAQHEEYYSGLNIVGEKEWFGGWPCHIAVYSDYALVVAHMYFSHSPVPELGKGHIVQRNEYGSYIVRYFKLGCEHVWETTLSRMCYREYVCTICGQAKSEDSSD